MSKANKKAHAFNWSTSDVGDWRNIDPHAPAVFPQTNEERYDLWERAVLAYAARGDVDPAVLGPWAVQFADYIVAERDKRKGGGK